MPMLNWIKDDNLITAVQRLLTIAKAAQKQAESEFEKNVIDPFSALFQISGFGIEFDSWLVSERTRQAQKTLQNHIGDFHQTILGSVEGWRNLKTGNIVDLVCDEKKIIAEVKNKHNTVTGGALSNLYKSLEGQVMPKHSIYKGYTAYYVTVIPKYIHRFNKPFAPSDKEKGEKCAENEKIRIIDGASFYNLVTGEYAALENLFDLLPDVIANCSGVSLSPDDKANIKKFFKLAFN